MENGATMGFTPASFMAETIRIFISRAGLILAGVAAIGYIVACLVLRFGQSRVIFFTSRDITITPDQLNLPYEEVWLSIKTPSEIVDKVHGWWLPSTNSQEEERVILDLHGNSSNISANLGYAQQFHQMGLSVLLIDYRGYGRSTNRFPCEKRVYQDVEAAWNYLVYERRINPHNIFVFGHSLGGAIAIDLASRHPEIAGLMIESSFTSIRKMVDFKGKYWIFPVDFLLTQNFNSIAKIPQLKMPILFTHGTEDRIVPFEMSQELFAAAIEPKQLLIVPGAGHNNVREFGGVQYLDTLRQFLMNYKL